MFIAGLSVAYRKRKNLEGLVHAKEAFREDLKSVYKGFVRFYGRFSEGS